MHLKTHKRRSFHRQGAALIVALMVMLMLAGMGLIAVQSAVQDMRATSNFRRDRQVQYVAEAGLMATMAEIARNGDSAWTQLKQQLAAGEISEPRLSFSLQNDFSGRLFTNPDGDVTKLDPGFTVVMANPLDAGQIPGYSEEFCFKSFDFTSNGEVGVNNRTVNLDTKFQRYAIRRYAATGMMGPLECEGN